MFASQWLHQLQRCLFPRQSRQTRNAQRRPPVHRRVQLCLEALEDRLAPSADLVAVAGGNLTTPFSANQQSLTLTATVNDAANSSTKVNEGTVSFTVKDQSGVTIGSTVTGNVSNGSASASFALPAGEAVGKYAIDVSYSDTADNFTDNGADDTAGTLTVADPTTTSVTNATTPFSTNDQTVTLTATVKSSDDAAINEGTVTFTVLQGTVVIGSAVTSNTVSNGNASVQYTLPGGTDAGVYTIEAAYSDNGGTFAASSGASQLSVTSETAAATTTKVTPPAAVTFSESNQNVTLTATVTSNDNPVNAGSVTFTLLDKNGNKIGSPIAGINVGSNGQAQATYVLPGGTGAGNYTVEADYTDSSGAFAISSDTSQSLAVNAATTTTTASGNTVTFSESAQNATLTATVTSSAGTVNEGSVQFTLVDSGGNTIGSPVSGTVANGHASVTYALPAGIAAGSYTIKAAYSDSTSGGGSGNFAASSDDTQKLLVSAAATTTTATSATAAFSTSAQNVTLTAAVTSSAGTINEGAVTFTLLDSNGNIIGTAISGAVNNGSASVNYTLPGGTAAGSYTINASYSDSAVNFHASSDDTQTLTVNTANATTVGLTTVKIVPNASNGTAQVTLTAQVNNPGGTVNEGVVSFTVADVSGQASVSNGTATVQLTVPLTDAANGLNVALSYTDNAASANFANSSATKLVSTSVWNALLSANVTFDSSNDQQMQFSLGNLPLFSAFYSASTGLLSQISLGSLSVPVTYTTTGNSTVASIDGVPWGMILYNANGQFQGIANVQTTTGGSLEWVIYDSNHQQTGTVPYSG